MEKIIEVRYASGSIRNYQKDILSAELTELFLPVSWIEHAGGSTGMYNAEGYRPVTEMFGFGVKRKNGADIAYSLSGYVISVIGAAMEAENRYLFPEDYDISPELVYARVDAESLYSAKLIWKSALTHSPEKNTAWRFSEGLKSLLGLPACRNADDPDGYIAGMVRILSEDHPGLAALYSRIDGFRKSIQFSRNH